MTKFNSDTKAKLVEGYKLGMTQKLACQYAGITVSCFHQWRGRAEQECRQEYIEFFEALKKAEAQSAAHALATIKRAAQDGTWTAAAWLLERRHEYRRQDTMAVEPQLQPERVVDMNTPAGREEIISQVSQLPEEMILAALNRSDG